MTPAELTVWGIHEGKQYSCIMEDKETSNKIAFFSCEIQSPLDATFEQLMVNLPFKLHQSRQYYTKIQPKLYCDCGQDKGGS